MRGHQPRRLAAQHREAEVRDPAFAGVVVAREAVRVTTHLHRHMVVRPVQRRLVGCVEVAGQQQVHHGVVRRSRTMHPHRPVPAAVEAGTGGGERGSQRRVVTGAGVDQHDAVGRKAPTVVRDECGRDRIVGSGGPAAAVWVVANGGHVVDEVARVQVRQVGDQVLDVHVLSRQQCVQDRPVDVERATMRGPVQEAEFGQGLEDIDRGPLVRGHVPAGFAQQSVEGSEVVDLAVGPHVVGKAAVAARPPGGRHAGGRPAGRGGEGWGAGCLHRAARGFSRRRGVRRGGDHRTAGGQGRHVVADDEMVSVRERCRDATIGHHVNAGVRPGRAQRGGQCLGVGTRTAAAQPVEFSACLRQRGLASGGTCVVARAAVRAATAGAQPGRQRDPAGQTRRALQQAPPLDGGQVGRGGGHRRGGGGRGARVVVHRRGDQGWEEAGRVRLPKGPKGPKGPMGRWADAPCAGPSDCQDRGSAPHMSASGVHQAVCGRHARPVDLPRGARRRPVTEDRLCEACEGLRGHDASGGRTGSRVSRGWRTPEAIPRRQPASRQARRPGPHPATRPAARCGTSAHAAPCG